MVLRVPNYEKISPISLSQVGRGVVPPQSDGLQAEIQISLPLQTSPAQSSPSLQLRG